MDFHCPNDCSQGGASVLSSFHSGPAQEHHTLQRTIALIPSPGTEMRMGNQCCYVSNRGDFAMKYLEKGMGNKNYLEATDLLINLSNQPMEELGVIKR